MVDRSDGDVTARCSTAAYRTVDSGGYVVHVVEAFSPVPLVLGPFSNEVSLVSGSAWFRLL